MSTTAQPSTAGPAGGTEFELELDGLTLRGLRFNAGAPVRVLALHGWLDNAASFAPVAEYLPDAIDLAALDLVGHGHSDPRPAGTWYHFIDYVRDTALAAERLGWQRFHLLGHSLGGAVATCTAAAIPERIQSLLLIEGLGPLAGDSRETASRLRQACRGLRNADPERLRRYATLDQAVGARRAKTPMAEVAARAIVERGMRAVEGGWIWRTDPRLRVASATRFTEVEVLNLLGAIECPALSVNAEPATPILSGQHINRRLAMLAEREVHSVRGGHHLHVDAPRATAAILFAFALKHRER